MDEFSPACPSVMHIFSQAVAANPPPQNPLLLNKSQCTLLQDLTQFDLTTVVDRCAEKQMNRKTEMHPKKKKQHVIRLLLLQVRTCRDLNKK